MHSSRKPLRGSARGERIMGNQRRIRRVVAFGAAVGVALPFVVSHQAQAYEECVPVSGVTACVYYSTGPDSLGAGVTVNNSPVGAILRCYARPYVDIYTGSFSSTQIDVPPELNALCAG
jgi:hypothetical protein